MASESLLGTSGTALAAPAKNQLDKFMTDTIVTSVNRQNVGNGATIAVGAGSKGDVNVAITPPTAVTQGSMTDGVGKTLNFQLPANTGLVSKSVDTASTTTAQEYVKSIVDKYIPDNSTNAAAVAQKATILAALTRAVEMVRGLTTVNVTIRNIDFFSSSSSTSGQQDAFTILDNDGSYQGIDSLVGANDVLLDAGNSTGSQLFVLNLAGLGTKTLVLQNVEGAVLAAGGTVKVEGSTPIRITSDSQAQNVTGGGGNDTLVGTGSDTLTGGAGNDIFGFSGVGKYTVTDFNKAGDMLAFQMDGVTNIDQLKAKVTSVVKVGANTTFNLGADTSITLVGVSASDLTAAMIKFTI